MTTQDENSDTIQNSAYNPFPEPQTIPSGWDTSVLLSATQTDSVFEAVDTAESESS